MTSGVKLSDTVISKLRKMITTNSKPGDRLPTEKDLAQIFGVGRSSIREALKVFSTLGLVERRNEGTFVARTTNDCLVEPLSFLIQMELADLTDVLELREILELWVVKRAATMATDQDVATFEQLLWQMEKPGLETEEFIKADIQFHSALARVAGNAAIGEILQAIRTIILRFQGEACGNPPIQKLAIATHSEIVQAIKRRNPRAAQNSMQKHLKVSRIFHGFHEKALEE
ncbi:MAG: FadR family transcriptional regulator [Deltaproteobacteria bacterium]|nr:FadR family transcriptional regulator [Deltaproteobacteria bacterium]